MTSGLFGHLLDIQRDTIGCVRVQTVCVHVRVKSFSCVESVEGCPVALEESICKFVRIRVTLCMRNSDKQFVFKSMCIIIKKNGSTVLGYQFGLKPSTWPLRCLVQYMYALLCSVQVVHCPNYCRR